MLENIVKEENVNNVQLVSNNGMLVALVTFDVVPTETFVTLKTSTTPETVVTPEPTV